jgi:hypothetical protein
LTSAVSAEALAFHVRYWDGSVGRDTPYHLWRPFLALNDLLRSPAPLFAAPTPAYGVRLVKDLGTHGHEVGNPSGGRFAGDFRDLLIELPSGENAMCGLCIFSLMKAVAIAALARERAQRCSSLLYRLTRSTDLRSSTASMNLSDSSTGNGVLLTTVVRPWAKALRLLGGSSTFSVNVSPI